MKNRSFSRTSILVFVLFMSTSLGCSMKLVENYDAEVSSSIIKVAKTTDAFLLNIMVTSSVADGSRVFENYAGGYAAVENELISLRLQNQVRPVHNHAFQVTEASLETWLDFAGKHEQNDTISDALIDEMRITMQQVFRAMLIEEEAEKLLMLE